MCSFYNPNIQSNFNEGKREFPQLAGLCIASFMFIYENREDKLEFVKIKNRVQHRQLIAWDSHFQEVLSDMVLMAWYGKIQSLSDYIFAEKTLKIKDDYQDGIYITAKLNDFLDLLFFSEFGKGSSSCPVIHYDSSWVLSNIGEFDVFYTLYDRLQLYDYIFTHSVLEVSTGEITSKKKELKLHLKVM
jgi:hypothetical protein